MSPGLSRSHITFFLSVRSSSVLGGGHSFWWGRGNLGFVLCRGLGWGEGRAGRFDVDGYLFPRNCPPQLPGLLHVPALGPLTSSSCHTRQLNSPIPPHPHSQTQHLLPAPHSQVSRPRSASRFPLLFGRLPRVCRRYQRVSDVPRVGGEQLRGGQSRGWLGRREGRFGTKEGC